MLLRTRTTGRRGLTRVPGNQCSFPPVRSSHANEEPPAPGLSVRPDCLEPLGLSVTKAAEVLGVTRQALNDVINGKSRISPEMAIRLSKTFGSSAETWRGMQLAYALAHTARREGEPHVPWHSGSE